MKPLAKQLITFAFAALTLSRLDAETFFFGEVPVQYVARGDEMVLDLHRFLQPPDAKVAIEGAGAELNGSAFTLRLTAGEPGI